MPGHGTTCTPDTTCCGGFWAEDFAKCCTNGSTCSEGIRHTGCCAAGKLACAGKSLYPGCCDADQICCGSTYESPWCCSKDHGICCGSEHGGSGRTCCDSRTEVCLANGTCAAAGGQPAGCGGQCTTDADCISGGTACSSCVRGPTGDYNVCAKLLNMSLGAAPHTVRVTSKYIGPDGVSALYVVAAATASSATTVETSVVAAAGGCAAGGSSISWFGSVAPTAGGQLRTFTLPGSANTYCEGRSVPCKLLLTNAAPPPAVAAEVGVWVYPFLIQECTVDVTVTRGDTAAGAMPADIPLYGAAVTAVLPAPPSILTWQVAGGKALSPATAPYTLSVGVAPGCTGTVLVGSGASWMPVLGARGAAVSKGVAPELAQPSVLVYAQGGNCTATLNAAMVAPTPLDADTSPASAAFVADFTSPLPQVVLPQQFDGGKWPQDSYSACVNIEVASGSCCVFDATTGRGYIYPVESGKKVVFPLSYSGPVTTPSGPEWIARLDLWAPITKAGSDPCDDMPVWDAVHSGGCKGTVTFNHSKNCY